MPKLIILGSSNAIPDWDHENTHMLVVGKTRTVLIDCVNNTLLRLEKAGVDFNNLTDMILTHFHPDHVSGVPLLLMDMWLMGRQKPLVIHALSFTNKRMKNLLKNYGWSDWPHIFPVKFDNIPNKESAAVLACEDFDIVASPVQHFIPTIGLKIHSSHKTIAYSSDTEPCGQILRLAREADILFHKSSGALPGHTSAEQAGEQASAAQVKALYLIHYPTGKFVSGDPVAEARKKYNGTIELATDFLTFEL